MRGHFQGFVWTETQGQINLLYNDVIPLGKGCVWPDIFSYKSKNCKNKNTQDYEHYCHPGDCCGAAKFRSDNTNPQQQFNKVNDKC